MSHPSEDISLEEAEEAEEASEDCEGIWWA